MEPMFTLRFAATLACLSATVDLAAQGPLPTVFSADPAHSLLDFTVRLVGFNRIRGTFRDWRADIAANPLDPADGFVAFEADVRSIATQDDERDQHLLTPDFFDAARFPRISFEGKIQSGSGNQLVLEGDLTIRDSTRRIRFPAERTTPEGRDPFGNQRTVFSTRVAINRRDFGVVGPRFWNQAISDSVIIEIELAARIWNYAKLGFGRGTAVYGPMIVAAADSGRFDAAAAGIRRAIAEERDSTRMPTDFEIEVTAGRLIQKGKLLEALTAVTMAEPGAETHWTRSGRSNLLTRKGELLIRLGRAAEARSALDAAVALNPSNTNARTWRWVARSPDQKATP